MFFWARFLSKVSKGNGLVIYPWCGNWCGSVNILHRAFAFYHGPILLDKGAQHVLDTERKKGSGGHRDAFLFVYLK